MVNKNNAKLLSLFFLHKNNRYAKDYYLPDLQFAEKIFFMQAIVWSFSIKLAAQNE